jgi:tetratricopeptide (TPR) repeat protein
MVPPFPIRPMNLQLQSSRRLRFLVLPLLALPLFASCFSNDGKPKELSDEKKVGLYYERAMRYYGMRELDRCQDQVQKGLELEPDNERLLLMLGRCHQTRGTLQDVLMAEQIFRDHPAKKDYRVVLCLAGSLERKGTFFDEAANAVASGDRFTEALDPQVRSEELKENALDAWEEAYSTYAEALVLYTGSFETLNGLMRTAVYLGRFEESLEWSTQFLESLAGSNDLFNKKLREQELRGESSVDVEKTLLDNMDLETEIRLHRSELMYRDGKSREALIELNEILAKDETVAEVYARRGQILHILGEYQRSSDSLERFMSLSEDPFEHPNVRQAFTLIEKNKAALAIARDTASQ